MRKIGFQAAKKPKRFSTRSLRELQQITILQNFVFWSGKILSPTMNYSSIRKYKDFTFLIKKLNSAIISVLLRWEGDFYIDFRD